MTKKIAVIGANGFLGSHLVDTFVESGHQVTAFDRFSSGTTKFITAPDRLIRGDFEDLDAMVESISDADLVFHALSLTNATSHSEDPAFEMTQNVAQTIRLIDAAAKNNVKEFYFLSSGGTIYGDSRGPSLNENSATFPVSAYGIGKLSVEGYMRYYARSSNLRAVSLRISNPYGARQTAARGQGLIPSVFEKFSLGQPILQYGDGSMQRDYIYVNDLMQMVTRIANASEKHEIYNLGSGRGTSVSEVIGMIAAILKADVELDVRPTPPSFIQNVVLDISRYEGQFGHPSLTEFSAGLEKTINSWRGVR
jgi:UDP-glucose 4-epimerase